MSESDPARLSWRIGHAIRQELDRIALGALRCCSFSLGALPERLTFRAELDRVLTDAEDHALWVASIEVHTYGVVDDDTHMEMLTELVPCGEPLHPLPGGIAVLRAGESFDPAFPGEPCFLDMSPITADPQQLLDRHGGQGIPIGATPRGQRGFREWFAHEDGPIGCYVDPETGASVPTSQGTIHYMPHGAFIIPTRPAGAAPAGDLQHFIALAARRALRMGIPASLLLFSFQFEPDARSLLFRASVAWPPDAAEDEDLAVVVAELHADRIFGIDTAIGLEVVSVPPGETPVALPGGVAFRRF